MTRSIVSLCSGIGGLELGLEAAGVGRVTTQVEIDPGCRAVLARHWPHATRLRDLIAVADGIERHDVLCAGFPCQPVSVAGKRKAQDDPRWLWPHVARAIDAARPVLVVVENVPGLRSAGLRDVLADLARLGFDAAWDYLSAADVGSPHFRRRLFVCAWRDVAANADGSDLRQQPEPEQGRKGQRVSGCIGARQDVADADCQGQPQQTRGEPIVGRRVGDGSGRVAQPGVGRDVDGLFARLDAHRWPAGRGCAQEEWEPPRATARFKGRGARLKQLGNAVVPQVAEVVGRWALACAGLEPEARA